MTKYRTTAPHYLPGDRYVEAGVEIGEGTQFPLPKDWPPSDYVEPLNDAAENAINNRPAVMVASEEEPKKPASPTVKNDPVPEAANKGNEPFDPASPGGPKKPEIKPTDPVRPPLNATNKS